MIESVKIIDSSNTPISYLSEVFNNGDEFIFKPGINIIIGENGSGKTTLLKLIERYLLIEKEEQSISFINKLYKGFNTEFRSGVEIISDYTKATFRFCHIDELSENSSDKWLKNKRTISSVFSRYNSSTGEGVIISINSFFSRIFSNEVSIKFPEISGEHYPEYKEYIEKNHRLSSDFTLLFDEPDRNLSLKNLKEILPFLSIIKENTQIISVIHNPLLIYKLSKNPNINFIELTLGYKDEVCKNIENIINDER